MQLSYLVRLIVLGGLVVRGAGRPLIVVIWVGIVKCRILARSLVHWLVICSYSVVILVASIGGLVIPSNGRSVLENLFLFCLTS